MIDSTTDARRNATSGATSCPLPLFVIHAAAKLATSHAERVLLARQINETEAALSGL